jgi:Domain of unknown function (DUF4394)
MKNRMRRWSLRVAAVSLAALLTACAGLMETQGPPRKELVHAVTAGMELVQFNAGQPQRILSRQRVTGLAQGERLVGIDYRVARGVLYALSSSGRLYTLDTTRAALQPVGTMPSAVALAGSQFGFDFNPAADRIRVVSDTGQNLRLHPDTGAAVDGNPALEGVQADAPLAYAAGDRQAGQPPALVAAGYTYNKKDDKITTNFAIDRRLGALVMQGSAEGTSPVVSPNTGVLTTIGLLGLGALVDASFDIADVSGAAFAAVRTAEQPRTRLYQINLATGSAQFIGTVGDGAPLVGMAVEP